MSYVVLARKWRPMSFRDLIGQEHVSRTLGNAIATGRVAHAFLFTGVRGVGKTTAARILAKALNCLGPPEAPTTGPTTEPCLRCSACNEITAGTDVDVREIDGASYTGVDDVRKLQDSIPYRPTRDRYKIFIVDEVHMLSQNAWNAFLKTLEEPPPHVKFIFATTEVHKVPVTILSRVQRFDFKLIPTRLIADRLRHVLREEGIESDEQAIALLAREAAGSMRDAMSLLDQVIAWGDARLEGDSVARVLGVASHTVLYDLVRAVVEGDPSRALLLASDLANQGFDIPTVARDILSLFRDLVVAKVSKDPSSLLDLPDEEAKDVRDLAAQSDTDDLLRLHQGFSQSYDEVVKSGQPRAALEMLLVRLARRPALLPIDDLVTRLAALERRLTGGTPPRQPPGGPAGTKSGDPRPPPRSSQAPSPHRSSEALSEPPVALTPPRQADVALAAPHEVTGTLPRPNGHGRAPARRVDVVSPAEPRSSLSGPTRGAEDSLSRWSPIVERVRAERADLAAFLHHATPLVIEPSRVVLGYEAGSVVERGIRTPESIQILTACAEACLGARPVITFQALSVGEDEVTLSKSAERERQLRRKESVARAESHPRIAELSEILGARLKEIQLPEE